MKKAKVMGILLAMGMCVAAVGCGKTDPVNENVTTTPETTETQTTEPETTESETTEPEVTEPEVTEPETTEDVVEIEVMTHDDYIAAELDTEVTVACYVQATQSWWDGKITVYAADEDGAYFIYNMACSEEDADKLTEGTGIVVHGYKAEWSGEVEIADAEFTFLADGSSYVSSPVDVTALLGTDELIDHQNEKVSFDNLTVEPSTDADGNEAAFLYNWDGSGSQGDDLYFNASIDGNTYTFTVESYLCGSDTDIYKAVEELNIGDTVYLEGFLYWYEGPNPHIIGMGVRPAVQ